MIVAAPLCDKVRRGSLRVLRYWDLVLGGGNAWAIVIHAMCL